MSDPTNLRLAVFDLDGTLLDSTDSIVTGVKLAWQTLGFPEPDPAVVKRTVGLPWEKAIPMILPGVSEAEMDKVRSYHQEVAQGLRRRPPRNETLFEGAREALDALETAGFLLGIVTSRAQRRLLELLEAHDLRQRFVTLKTVDHGPGKPNPHLLNLAMAEAGVDRSDTVMIGDTTFDIEMARNAGTASVGVSWGVHEVEELSAAGADHIVDAFHEVPAVVHRLTGS